VAQAELLLESKLLLRGLTPLAVIDLPIVRMNGCKPVIGDTILATETREVTPGVVEKGSIPGVI
jgi:hypothetical protein